jgi:hypothetical protein
MADVAAGRAGRSCEPGLRLTSVARAELAAQKSLHATERNNERVRTLRQQQVEAIAARSDAGRFHFLDETGLRLDYTRRYGQARGAQSRALAPPSRSLILIGTLLLST